MTHSINNQDLSAYIVDTAFTSSDDDTIIARALAILESRLRTDKQSLSSPTSVKKYLQLKMSELEHEEFVMLSFDATMQLIDSSSLFRGTLTSAAVYPREVVKHALKVNAACVIFAHNHPSGSSEASPADIALTKTLAKALALIDTPVRDHIIVTAGKNCFSFAENGMI